MPCRRLHLPPSLPQASVAGSEVGTAASEMDARDSSPVPVDALTQVGISSADIIKLKQGGIYSLTKLDATSKRELVTIKGLSEGKIDKMKEGVQQLAGGGVLMKGGTFMTGLQKRELDKRIKRVTTGAVGFDAILGGGFASMEITELFGESRSGKTQICHTLCVTGQLGYDNGGGQGKALYIDTEVCNVVP